MHCIVYNCSVYTCLIVICAYHLCYMVCSNTKGGNIGMSRMGILIMICIRSYYSTALGFATSHSSRTTYRLQSGRQVGQRFLWNSTIDDLDDSLTTGVLFRFRWYCGSGWCYLWHSFARAKCGMTRHDVLVPLIDHENPWETLATWKIFRLRECKKPTLQIAELSSRDHMKTNTMNSRLSRLGISWYRFYETSATADARYWRSNLEAMERHSLWPVGHSSQTASLLHSPYHFYGFIMIFLVLLTSPNNVQIWVHSASSSLLISFNLYQFINKAGSNETAGSSQQVILALPCLGTWLLNPSNGVAGQEMPSVLCTYAAIQLAKT